jgi:hypothetical protein
MADVFRTDGDARMIVPVGDSIAEGYQIPVGFVRQNGKQINDRDNSWPGNSAFFCLNDKSQNLGGKGSAFVMFNAFENLQPVEMNKRAADSSNCPDLVQVGPRIVEYKSSPGIFRNEKARTSNEQYYAVFAQGSGPKYDAYIIINRDPINLFYIQTLLLKDHEISNLDLKMRMAVNLISGRDASLIVGANGSIAKQVGTPDAVKHPVYLAVTPIGK